MPSIAVSYILSKKLACYREVMSYERLKHLQGVHIPCSYGFYEVRYPI